MISFPFRFSLILLFSLDTKILRFVDIIQSLFLLFIRIVLVAGGRGEKRLMKDYFSYFPSLYLFFSFFVLLFLPIFLSLFSFFYILSSFQFNLDWEEQERIIVFLILTFIVLLITIRIRFEAFTHTPLLLADFVRNIFRIRIREFDDFSRLICIFLVFMHLFIHLIESI